MASPSPAPQPNTGSDEDNIYRRYTLFIEEIQPKPADLLKAGQWLVNEIQNRTLRGIDAEGSMFAAYSPRYARRKGVPASAVTLYGAPRLTTHSGPHMLSVLQAQYNEDTSSLDVGIFGDEEAAERARVNNEGASIRTRLGSSISAKYITTKKGGIRKMVGGKFVAGKAVSTIPQRQWLAASEADLLEMQQIIQKSINERVAQTNP